MSFLLTFHYGGLPREEFLICATTVCTVCGHAQPKWAKNSSHTTSAPAHEDSPRRRIVRWLSAYFLVPNSRSRSQSSIKLSSRFQRSPRPLPRRQPNSASPTSADIRGRVNWRTRVQAALSRAASFPPCSTSKRSDGALLHHHAAARGAAMG